MKEFRGQLNKIIHDIKESSGWRPGKTSFDVNQMGLVSESIALWAGRPVKRKIFVFRSNGCHWARKNGCSMCGYYTETTGEQGAVRVDNYVAQLHAELEKTDFSEYPVACLFTAGSFLDDWEFPWEAAQEVFRLLGQEKDLKKVVIESCAQYVNEEKIKRLKELIGDKFVEVGIGLEVADDYLLRNSVNKQFTLEDYKGAVGVLRQYFGVLSYVLVKPPFVTEREALDMAVRTGRYAFECGSTAVSLEPMYVERHTLVDYLYREGYLYTEETFRPPWLWTVFEAARVLRREFPDREVRIGCSQELPTPYHVARNCDLCSDEAYRRIELYDQTYDIGVLDGLECVCKREWEAVLEAPGVAGSIEDRIEGFVNAYHANNRQLICLST